jgi:hypothetical protein
MAAINSSTDQQQKEAAVILFKLKPGDRITDCSGLWSTSDRVLEELATCHHCRRPTFRVLTITSRENLERRAAVCGRHFIDAARVFPELQIVAQSALVQSADEY